MQPGGELAGPVRADRGFHVIKLVERKVKDAKPLSEVQDDIRIQLRQKEMEKPATKTYLAELAQEDPGRRPVLEVRAGALTVVVNRISPAASCADARSLRLWGNDLTAVVRALTPGREKGHDVFEAQRAPPLRTPPNLHRRRPPSVHSLDSPRDRRIQLQLCSTRLQRRSRDCSVVRRAERREP